LPSGNVVAKLCPSVEDSVNRSANRRAIVAVTLALCLVPLSARAQSKPEFIAFPGISKGALYRPDNGSPHVGILVMHRTANYLNHRACTELSRRGFLMLCMNTRYENNEPLVNFEKLPLDVKAGVEFLRRQAGITKVVLFAHSGGGPLMSLYQAVAENGPTYCKGSNKLTECGDDLAGLPPADGIVFADAHPSNAVNTLRGLNPAVADEGNPPAKPLIPELNPFDPKNGFNPNGPSHYSAEFQARYFKAQAGRMNRLINSAQDKLARMKRNDYPYPDDDIIVIPRGGIRVTGRALPPRCLSRCRTLPRSTRRRGQSVFYAMTERSPPKSSRVSTSPTPSFRRTTCASAPGPRSIRCARS
jgi:hypothetical protein